MGLIFKSKKEREEEKQIQEYIDEMDKLEAEVDKELGEKEEKNLVLQIFNIIEKDPLEDELEDFYTKEQKQKQARDKKEAKRYSVVAIIIFMCICIAGFISIAVFYKHNLDDMHKIYEPKIIEFYESKYGETPKISEIGYQCYEVLNAEKKKEKICTDYIYAITDKDELILYKDNEYATALSIEPYYKSYNEYIKSINPNMQLIWNNPLISNSEFYNEFKQYSDYSKILPTNSNFNFLLNSYKMNVVDIIMYQGEININGVKTFLTQLTNDSKFVFIKMNAGTPINMTVIDKAHTYSLDVTGSTNPYDKITNYQLDKDKNNIADIKISKITDNSISPPNNKSKKKYEYSNAYEIDYSENRGGYRDDRKNLPSYYLLMFDGCINGDNLIEINGIRELEKDNYREFYSLSFGGKTYIVSENKLGLANKQETTKKGGIFG